MNSYKSILAFLLTILLTLSRLTSCDMLEDLAASLGDMLEDPSGDVVETPDDGLPEELAGYEVTSIEEAKALAVSPDLDPDKRYYILAAVDSITNAAYGAMTVSDSTGSISVYNSKNKDGSVGYPDMDDKPAKGDTVHLLCTLGTYNGEAEIKSAWIVKTVHAIIDDSAYYDMTIEEARSVKDGTPVKLRGVVARITYANGLVPAGFILIDDTSSIYVYDKNTAAVVSEGNTVTVIGEKDHWILDKEQSHAEKFGYTGCNQLVNATVTANDNGVSNFNTEWIEETTVKDILGTPVTDDITTLVYRVDALIEKTPGTGFTNYYIKDLDGTTSSYVYTQCNGSDFAWMDEFDGKICSVYLTAINAKASASGCTFRFQPIAIEDKGYVFNTAGAAEHAVKYYGMDQFLTEYYADPSLELITSVSSELLGFENATLSYTSSDENVVYFATEGGATVMHCANPGTAIVTVTGEYGGNTYTDTAIINVSEALNYDFVSVSDAIGAEIGAEITVKGIVGPSLVNKDGFYLIDGNNIIAVLVDSNDEFDGLSIGNEIILSGVRAKTDATKSYGQTHIKGAKVLVNMYGTHEIPVSENEITVDEFSNLDEMTDLTTTTYKMQGVVTIEGNSRYKNLLIKSPDTSTTIRLYASNADQYSWLYDYEGEEITFHIIPCNWNDKTYYTGCALSIVLDGGTVIYNSLNFNNN